MVTPGAANELIVTWTGPTNTDHTTAYELDFTSAAVGDVANDAMVSGNDPALAWIHVLALPDLSDTSYTIDSDDGTLVNGVTYRVRLRTVSIDSAYVFATGTPWAGTAPANVAAQPGDASFTVSWTAVAGAEFYSIDWGPNLQMTFATAARADAPATSLRLEHNPQYTSTNIVNGTTYKARVAACVGEGDDQRCSDWSPTVTVTPEAPPVPDETVPDETPPDETQPDVNPSSPLSVDAIPACGTRVTDLSVLPETTLVLTPAPATWASIDYRWLSDTFDEDYWIETNRPRIGTSGRSTSVLHASFADLGAGSSGGITGIEFRLRDDPGVTARCTWLFEDDDSGDTRTPPTTPDGPPTTPADPPVDPPANPPATDDGGGAGGGSGGGDAVSSDASLAGLTARASADGTDFGETLALTPDFDAAVADYTAAVSHATTHIRLTPTAGHEDATVGIGPRGGERTETASGEPGPAFALAVGENVFEIAVTAEDGETVRTWTVTVSRAPPPVPRDGNAAREHLFPLLADGAGFRSRLFLTNVSAQAQNSCALTLHGAGLDAARFQTHSALTVSDGELTIDPGDSDAGVALATGGTGELAFGYARLSCAEPAVARLLLVRESGGVPAALANEESARTAHRHYFPLPARLGRPGLALANDSDTAAACAVETEAGGGNVAVPAGAAVFRFLDEVVSMETENGEESAGGAVTVTCDRPVAALGVPLTAAGVFTALHGAAPETEEETPARRVLPVVLDGAGFRSRLEVTNRSDAANRCTLEFHGAGVSTARFPAADGVTRDGFSRAAFELARDGRIAMTSFGRHSYAYGYAVLDCEGPVEAQNLLTAGGGEEVDGMAPIPAAQFARELRFPVAPGLDGMALFLTNAGEAGAVCAATLTPADGEEIAAGASIEVKAESTALRFLADLFELPDDFAGGDAKLSCDRNVAATALPNTAGAAFAAVPPVAPGRE